MTAWSRGLASTSGRLRRSAVIAGLVHRGLKVSFRQITVGEETSAGVSESMRRPVEAVDEPQLIHGRGECLEPGATHPYRRVSLVKMEVAALPTEPERVTGLSELGDGDPF